MDDLESLIDGAEPAVSQADRQALIDALMQEGMRQEPWSSLRVIGLVIVIAVIAPLLIFAWLLLVRPVQPQWGIILVFVPTVVLPLWMTYKARARYRIKVARLMRERGFRPGSCPRCQYNLRGLSGPSCPECGEPIGPIQVDMPDP